MHQSRLSLKTFGEVRSQQKLDRQLQSIFHFFGAFQEFYDVSFRPRAAAGRCDQSEQNFHGRRLARSVGSQEAEGRMVLHRQVEAPKGLNRF
jgi:hypothetical protein